MAADARLLPQKGAGGGISADLGLGGKCLDEGKSALIVVAGIAV